MNWFKSIRPLGGLSAIILGIASLSLESLDNETKVILLWYMFIGVSATNAYNNWCDREHDKKKGRYFVAIMGHKYLFFVTLLWTITGITALYIWTVDESFGVLSFILFLMGFSYNYVRKVPLLSMFWVSTSTTAVTFYALLSSPSTQTALFSLLTFVIVTTREMIKDIEDVGIDMGYKETFAVKFGRKSAKVLAELLVIAIVIMSISFYKESLYAVPILMISLFSLLLDSDKISKTFLDLYFLSILLLFIFHGI